MTLKEVLNSRGYSYNSIFTAHSYDIDFESTEELCYALGYILKHVHRVDAEIPEQRSDILRMICPNYPITNSYTSGGHPMKWSSQFRIYFETLRNMPQKLRARVQNDSQMRLSGSLFVESLLYIGFDPGEYQNAELIGAAIYEIFDDPNEQQAFEEGYAS